MDTGTTYALSVGGAIKMVWKDRAYKIILYDKEGLEVENCALHPDDWRAVAEILCLGEVDR